LTSNTVCITSAGKLYQSTKESGAGRKRADATSSCKEISVTKGAYAVYSCKTENSSTTCETANLASVTSTDGSTTPTIVLYYNDNGTIKQKTDFTYLDKTNKKLLICDSTGACTVQSTEGIYYVDTTKSNAKTPLIQVTSTAVTELTAVKDGTYAAYDGKIITCTSATSCTAAAGKVGEVYVNSAKTADKPIIQCSAGDDVNTPAAGGRRKRQEQTDANAGSGSATCEEAAGVVNAFYINAGPNKSSKPMIKCKSATSCEEIAVTKGAHYLNAAVEGEVIECSAASACAKMTVSGGEVFVNSAVTSGLTDALITCPAAASGGSNGGTTVNNGNRRRAGENETGGASTSCSKAEGKAGYYLNSGSNKSESPLIVCDAKACKESVGGVGAYYLNAMIEGEVIECSAANACAKKDVKGGEVFVNSAVTSGLTDALITCPAAASGGSNGGTTVNNGNRRRAGENETGGASTSCSKAEGKAGYYLNSGSNKSESPLIVCDAKACKESVGGVGAYYLNAMIEGEVIECSAANACAKKDVKGGEVFVNSAVTSGLTDALITCPAATTETRRRDGTTTNPDTSATTNTGTDESIACEKTNGTANDYYLNAGVNKTESPLIVCDAKACKESTGTVGAHYLNAAVTGEVIECTEDKTCDKMTVSGGEVFVNSAVTSGLTDALITCPAATTETRRRDGTTTDPDTSTTTDGNTGTTTDSNSDAIACTAKDGIKNDYYMNAGTETLPLIVCDTNCEEKEGAVGTYLDGSTYTKDGDKVTYTNLIVCSDEGACTNENTVKAGIFVNGATPSGLTDALIECTGGESSESTDGQRKREEGGSSDETTCSKRTGIDKDFYLNAADSSQLISCTSSKCEEVEDSEIVAGNYLDGSTYTEGSPATYSKLIVCPASEATTKREGDECESVDATEGIYVHAAGNGLTDALISCKTAEAAKTRSDNTETDTTTPATCSKDTGVNKGYYLNAGSDNTDSPLIKCTSSEGCQSVALNSEDEKLVFLNANYKVGKDEEFPLIKCPSSDTASDNGTAGDESTGRKREETSAKCALATSAAEVEVPEFYVNGDRVNSEKDDDGALNNDIIKCVNNGSSAKRAATLSYTCGVSSGKVDDIFINGNYAASEKQIIKCTSEDGCIEAAAFPEDTSSAKREEGEGTPEGSGDSSNAVYYVNAGSVKKDKLQDTLIECPSASDACVIKEAKAENIYINTNTNQLILCYESNGCIAKTTNASENNNEFYMNSIDTEANLENDLIKCTVDEEKNKKCEPYTGVDKKVYINSYNPSQLIYCLDGEGCALKNSTATADKPEYYVNGDDIDFDSSAADATKREEGDTTAAAEDKRPLIGDLIECKVSGTTSKCSVINGHLGDVYINGNFDMDKTYPIIKCPETGCINVEVFDVQETLPEYYINSGNKAKDKFAEALIKCSKAGEACEVIGVKANEVYVNSNENQLDKPVIKCAKNSCSAVASAATESSKEYYINAGKASDTPLQYDIIECSVGSGEESTSTEAAGQTKRADDVTISCKCVEDAKAGVYMNSNYSESGDNNQLIQCSSDNGCVGVRTTSVEYYVNAESSDLNNAIIFCSNKKCEKQTPADINIYYVGKDSDNVNGLIECVETTEAETTTEAGADTEDTTGNQDEDPNESDTPERKRAAGDTVNKCTLKSAFTSQGYYLNSGYNKSVNQTIICDSTDGCNTVKVDLGYYVNAGNADKPIIKCEKEGNECVEEASKPCPDPAKAVPGNYCYEDSQLKFFTVNNSTAIAASKSDDTYAFATIPSNGFPGIKSETGSLFKISRYFINRFYQSGVIMIDKNGKLVDSLGGDTSDISLYDCNDSTKVCTERPGCTSNTYMFDSENRKAVFCNDGTLEYASFTGYVVDGNRVTSGTKHPYIIHCENGEKCTSFKPKSSTYYENSGYDASTNSLIQCNNNNCMTVVANVGYYVGHGESDNNGVIKCTTTTSCTYSQVKNKVKYVNAGFDKRNNAIIECKGGKCNVAKAKSGYYLTHTSTLLIQCTSPTTCAEFTPTVNYYDNADSSESSNTIINCIQNSNVVTCSSEATNNGFYMSSLSNVLIRCKAGHKCKTITVKNGIFRGALKGLTSSKRSDNVQNVHERDADDDLEEDGKMVNLRDNSDDAYGVIRCVAGKCAALSASELAAIPMCEFNNNKCYITLEYAMTKSATTSIAAGNICTNSDRSVFYFATDTVVVKPNVISGVTSTYVYTTTNSNCLEVNDSYNDMYFTVGSNIYTLDQGSVLQFYETGYYFLNVAKNTLVSGNEIDAYNDENVKLYRCNGSSCSIIDKPDANTYYADVNKRILKYNVNNDVFTFAYEKDIICIFANNKCTPNADLKNQEFCITYKGEIVLATIDIKNRETGECYRAGTINNYIYGYSQHLYHMNQFSAEMVDQTGFYIISLSTNTTVVSKNYKNKNNSIVVYGCNLSSCRVYEPDEDTYYYDAQAKNILRYKDGVWSSPSTSGYAYIAINPTNTYVYKFAKKGDEIIIQGKANYGYYYTIDDEMYHCDQEDGECKPIDETGYYFTNAGEIYYCVHDSEGLEVTECVKQNCVSGQYYYIDDAYYRCEVSSLLVPVVSRYCSYDDNVVVNFPLALTEEFPDKIKQAVDDIQKNNNSTAVVTRRGKNYLEAVSGIFTNCTYNVEETKSTFDLVCVNNYVKVDDETDEVKICNVDQLGYVECIEDEDNPEKCSVSGAFHAWKLSFFMTVAVIFFAMVMNN